MIKHSIRSFSGGAPTTASKGKYGIGKFTWSRGDGIGRKVFHKGWKHMESRKPTNLQERWHRASIERLFHPSIVESLKCKQIGDLHTKEYRLFFETTSLDFSPQLQSDESLNEYKLLSPWHDIPLGFEHTKDNTVYFNYCNEISLGNTAKMECATGLDWNPIKQDIKKGNLRFFKYGNIPFNYGFIPQTWEDCNQSSEYCDIEGLIGDNDPIDVVEISNKPMAIGEVIPIKVLSVLGLVDEGEMDWKIIGLRSDHPEIDKISNISDANKILNNDFSGIILDWFRNYKIPDGKAANTFTHNEMYNDSNMAVDIIEECHKQWYALILGGVENSELNKLSVTHKHLLAQGLTSNVKIEELPRIDYPKYDKYSPGAMKRTFSPESIENAYEEYELDEEAPDQRKK